MSEKDLSRRDFLKGAGVAGAAMLGGGGAFTLAPDARAAAGTPIPPMTMTYYSNWQEIVEFFRKAAQDLRKIGITPNLNPAVNTTVTAKTFNEQEAYYGDWSSIHWGAIDYRLDPSFFSKNFSIRNNQKKGEEITDITFLPSSTPPVMVR